MRTPALPASALVLFCAIAISGAQTDPSPAAATRVPVLFSGGHETDGQDRGRPVALIAGALGVPAEVFREAFTHVHPAQAGTEPDPDQVRRNKAALMAALGPYGITDQRLNAVSNYYRYNRSRGEMWPTKPAIAYAVLQNGAVASFVVTDGGSGYSSPPAVTVPGFAGALAAVQLSFGNDLARNGSVAALSPVARGKKPNP